MFRFLFITFIFLSSYASADVNAGIRAMQNRDYNRAFAEFQPEALSGNVEAQFQMCGLYFNGLGVPVNTTEAANWCQAAARQGHAEAAYNLGLMYFNGEGVGQNYVQSEYWFKEAANRGHRDAEFNLLQIYNSTRAVDNREELEQQFTNKQKQILIERQGQQVLPTAAPPIRNFDPAAEFAAKERAFLQAQQQPALGGQQIPQGVPSAIPQGAVIAPDPDLQSFAAVPQIPSQQPRRLSLVEQQEYRKSQACLQAVQAGIIPDNCFQATTLEETQGYEAEIAEPVETEIVSIRQEQTEINWLTSEADKGNVLALNNLGVMYRRGQDIPKDSKKAFALFEKGSAKGSTNAMLNLASMYKLGEGTEQNLELAYAWFNLAADRMDDGPQKQSARENVKEISEFLSNEQIGSALIYINELDESIPFYQENTTP